MTGNRKGTPGLQVKRFLKINQIIEKRSSKGVFFILLTF